MGQTENYTGRGGRADNFRGSMGGGSSNAAGSRPVVPSRDAWVQNGRGAIALLRKIPTPALFNYGKFHIRVRKGDNDLWLDFQKQKTES